MVRLRTKILRLIIGLMILSNLCLFIFIGDIVTIYQQISRGDVSHSNTDHRGAAKWTPEEMRKATRSPTVVNRTIDLDTPCDPQHDPIVNPHPFTVLLENPSLCAHPDLFLFIYVHSAPGHVPFRERIRRTYGNVTIYNPQFAVVKLMFAIGVPSDEAMRLKIRAEAAIHKDILQESYTDDYHNLTYKGRGAMGWIWKHCSHAKYILKTDDDEFVNVFPLIQHLKYIYEAGFTSQMILCIVWYADTIFRSGKWAIDLETLPERYEKYPPFCSGQGYIFSPDVARTLYNTSFYVPVLWVDDAYLTGILVKKAKLTHHNFYHAYQRHPSEAERVIAGEEWYKVILTETHDHKRYNRMWSNVTTKSRNFVLPVVKNAEPGLMWE